MGSFFNLLVIRTGAFDKAGFAKTDRLIGDFPAADWRCGFEPLLPARWRDDLRLRPPPLPPSLGYP